MTALLRAALAGAATGGRSGTGLAALALATPSRPATQPDVTLSRDWVKGGVVAMALGEIVADKLPMAPSRLEPAGLGFRCAAAAAAGLIVARRTAETGGDARAYPGEPWNSLDGAAGEAVDDADTRPALPSPAQTVACVAVATAAAVGTSWLGARWRGWAAGRTGHDYIGAVLEDILTVAVAGLSLRA